MDGTGTFVILGLLTVAGFGFSVMVPIKGPEKAPPRPQFPADRIDELERRLTDSTALSAAWEKRATSAEARVVELAKHQSGKLAGDDRFKRLRALLATELHPDHAKTDGIERVIRTELFKSLWPRIEEI